MTPQIASLMAEYNRWMNNRMYAAAATLPEAALVADMKAFFGSILGTLNHIAVADTIWLHRFARHEASFPSLRALSEFPQPSSLRQQVAPSLVGLREYRFRLDELIEQWVSGLTTEHLLAVIEYAIWQESSPAEAAERCCSTSLTTKRIIAGRHLRCCFRPV